MALIEGLAVGTFAAIVAAAGTSWGTAYFLQGRDSGKRELAERDEQIRLARALHSEVSAFMEIYKTVQLPDTAPAKEDEHKSYRLEQNYAAVYENNADRIGILKETDIPNIVSLYSYMNALADSLSILSDRWDKYAEYAANLPSLEENENAEEQDESDESTEEEKALRNADLTKRFAEVKSAYAAAHIYQDKVFILQKYVLENLAKYGM